MLPKLNCHKTPVERLSELVETLSELVERLSELVETPLESRQKISRERNYLDFSFIVFFCVKDSFKHCIHHSISS